MDDNPIVQKIREMIQEEGSQLKVAQKLGISQSYLSDILMGNRPVSKSIAKMFGFVPLVTYLRTDGIFTGKGDEIGAILEKRDALRRTLHSQE